MSTLKVAKEAGARTLVLCDTNGGTLPSEIKKITFEVEKKIGNMLGIHCHNDMGMAVANSIISIESGVSHIQGTFVGVGERCGNTNLSTVIPTIALKMNLNIKAKNYLKDLTAKARYISEISNIQLEDSSPYIGKAAFAHKEDAYRCYLQNTSNLMSTYSQKW